MEFQTKSMLVAQERALKTSQLMEEVIKPSKMNKAYGRVESTEGPRSRWYGNEAAEWLVGREQR